MTEQSAETHDEVQGAPDASNATSPSKAVVLKSTKTNDVDGPGLVDRDVYESQGFKKLVATLLTLITLVSCGALAVLTLAGARGSDSAAWQGSLVAVLMAIVAVLITGIFVFMAFRIDRGARWEARQVAEEVSALAAAEAQKRAVYAATMRAEKVAKRVSRKRADIAHDAATTAAEKKAEEVAACVAAKTAREEATSIADTASESFRKMADAFRTDQAR